jgi:hypothetical protein
MPVRGFRRRGDDRTSCDRPFPGCPGLSQPRSRRVFHAAALRLFYQGTSLIVHSRGRKSRVCCRQLLHRRSAVDNLCTTFCSPVIHRLHEFARERRSQTSGGNSIASGQHSTLSGKHGASHSLATVHAAFGGNFLLRSLNFATGCDPKRWRAESLATVRAGPH